MLFLSLRVFGLLSSSLLLFPQRFGRYVLRPSSGVCLQPKRCGNNNKDEDNSPKTLNDKNHQASSQKFKQLISTCCVLYSFLNTFKFWTEEIKKNWGPNAWGELNFCVSPPFPHLMINIHWHSSRRLLRYSVLDNTLQPSSYLNCLKEMFFFFIHYHP